MPVEFLGIAATNDGSETTARSGASFDKDYTLRLARAHEENGWDRVLFAYGSGSPDPAPAAAYIASQTDKLQLLFAHRPNVSYPTFAAKTFATLDQISDGRLTVHFITGGNDHEQQREGDSSPRTSATRAPASTSRSSSRPGRRTSRSTTTGEHYRFARLRQRRLPGPAAAARRVVRRLLARRVRRRAVPRPTSTACGASRWPRPPSRSSR